MRIVRPLTLWFIGGLLYVLMEFLFRGYSHWTMFLVGGLCFYMVGTVNEIIPWEMLFWQQCIIGSLLITAVEFISGCIINIWLRWNVWDYSDMPLNLWGQICLPFTVIWLFVAGVAIILDDHLRYWLFGGDKPHYIIKRLD